MYITGNHTVDLNTQTRTRYDNEQRKT